MVLGEKGSLSMMTKGGIKGSGFMHGMSCISMIDSPEICNEDERFLVEEKVVVKENREELKALNTCSSSSTSSIGKNSDISGGSKENSGDTDEVQSSYKGPLDAMEALEEVLPIRRGISNFYNGKSKSFASLADASSSPSASIKEIAKPENAYIRKRRNLLACSLAWDNTNKTRNSPLRSYGGGVTKRVINSNRTSLAQGVAMSTAEIYNTKYEHTSPSPNIISGSPSSLLRTCLHSQLRDYHQSNGSSMAPSRQNFSAWRSLSLADLQHCVSLTAASSTSSNSSPLDIKPSQT